MAWSPYKERILRYVGRNPGCSKYDLARVCTNSSLRNPSKQYYIVNTALRHGWIEGHKQGNTYKLYLPDYVHPDQTFDLV